MKKKFKKKNNKQTEKNADSFNSSSILIFDFKKDLLIIVS